LYNGASKQLATFLGCKANLKDKMITPSFSLTATERVLPRLALDFTTASLDPRVTFTRAGNTATVINSSGKVAPINADLPRFDYNIGVGGACNGLLIEEARTNKQTAFNFNPASGSGILVSGSVSAVLSIVSDSTELAAAGLDVLCSNQEVWKLDNSLGVTNANAELPGTPGNTNAHTLSVWVRGTGNCRIRTTSATGAQAELTSSYVRRVVTVTPGASDRMWVNIAPGGVVFFIGQQLEEGSFATSLIPVQGSALTRNADIATMTGTNFSDWFNATEGTFAVASQIFGSSINRNLMTISDGTSNNNLGVRWASASQAQYTVTTLGSSQVNIAPAGYSDFNTTYKRVAAYKLNSFAQGINGILTGSDTSGTVPSVNQLIFANNATNSTIPLCGWIQNLYYWPQRLTNAEVTAFSK
jgi:hypothetical protein